MTMKITSTQGESQLYKEAFWRGFYKAAVGLEKIGALWQDKFKNKTLSEESLKRLGFNDSSIAGYSTSPSYNDQAQKATMDLLSERPGSSAAPGSRLWRAAKSVTHNYVEHPAAAAYNLARAQKSTMFPEDFIARAAEGLRPDFMTTSGGYYGMDPNRPTQEIRYPKTDTSLELKSLLKELHPNSWVSDDVYGSPQIGMSKDRNLIAIPEDFSIGGEAARAHEYGHDRITRMPQAQINTKAQVLGRALQYQHPSLSHVLDNPIIANEAMAHWEGTNPNYPGGVLARELPLTDVPNASDGGGARRLASVVEHLKKNYGLDETTGRLSQPSSSISRRYESVNDKFLNELGTQYEAQYAPHVPPAAPLEPTPSLPALPIPAPATKQPFYNQDIGELLGRYSGRAAESSPTFGKVLNFAKPLAPIAGSFMRKAPIIGVGAEIADGLNNWDPETNGGQNFASQALSDNYDMNIRKGPGLVSAWKNSSQPITALSGGVKNVTDTMGELSNAAQGSARIDNLQRRLSSKPGRVLTNNPFGEYQPPKINTTATPLQTPAANPVATAAPTTPSS